MKQRIPVLAALAFLAACAEDPIEPVEFDVEPAFFTGTFTSPTAGDLEDPADAYDEVVSNTFAKRNVGTFDGDRQYVRTVGTDFDGKDLTAELVFTLTNTSGDGATIHFFGIGPGEPVGVNNEPTGVFFRIHTPDVGAGIHVASRNAGGGSFTSVASIGNINVSGDTHRAIITKSGNEMTFEVDVGNDGSIDASHIVSDFTAVTDLDASNSRIYFGTSNRDTFTLSIDVVVDTDGDGVDDGEDVEPTLNNNYYYVDWTSGDLVAGTVSGVIDIPGEAPISVEFKVLDPDGSAGSFYGYQTDATGVFGPLAGWGTHDYWAPNAPYTSPYVLNPPPSYDIVALEGNTTSSYVITFSAPVQDPIMDVLSLGSGGDQGQYDFARPFEIVSQGTGFWGSGPFVAQPGEVLAGNEGHGTIRFIGSFSTFSWSVPDPETWHAFTIGVRGPGDPTADYDGDGIPDAEDSCPLVANLGSDFDGDGIDDACDSFDDSNADTDGDGLTNSQEQDLGTSPTNPDTDGDGVSDGTDAFPLDPTRSVADGDGDGVDDDVDNCPTVANADQADFDGDGQGDACDPDDDNDGVPDEDDAVPFSDTSATVVIGTCDSGVANQVLDDGSTFMDLIGAAAASSKNHGQFLRAVASLTAQWMMDGLISGREKGDIDSCNAQTNGRGRGR